MSNIIPFSFESRSVRVITDEQGEPLFVGKDVCEALGYTNPRKAMNDHCRGVTKRYPIVDTLGRTQEARVLAEPDVLRLIVNCSLPAAEPFERLVFEQILPTIRKTGAYISPSATLASLPEPIARQVGGIIKSVVARQIAEALASMLPAIVEREVAARNLTVRHGMTAGEVWQRYGLPRLKNGAQWLSRRLVALGRAVDGGHRGQLGGKTARLFDPDKVEAQMKVGGLLYECKRYSEARRGQGELFRLRVI